MENFGESLDFSRRAEGRGGSVVTDKVHGGGGRKRKEVSEGGH